MAVFSEKLRAFLTAFQIRNNALAKALNVDPSLVSYWLSGKRRPARDSEVLDALAAYIVWKCGSEAGTQWLGRQIAMERINPRLDYHLLLRAVRDWLLLDGPSTDAPSAPSDLLGALTAGADGTAPAAEVFPAAPSGAEPRSPAPAAIGMRGVLDLLRVLCAQMEHRGADAPVQVYVSSEQSAVLLAPECLTMLAEFALKSGGPVKILFEQGGEAGHISVFLTRLLPLISSGRAELLSIRSTEPHFCYNLTVYVGGVGMVMVMEPPEAHRSCVSFYVDAPSFVRPMGELYRKLSDRAQPLYTLLRPRDSALMAALSLELFAGFEDIDRMGGAIPAVFFSAAAHRLLLKAEGLTPEQLKYRTAQFDAYKRCFEDSLRRNRVRELLSLELLDRLVRDGKAPIADLAFLGRGSHRLEPALVRDLLEGMFDYARGGGAYQLRLTRKELPAPRSVCMQGDRLLLTQTPAPEGTQGLYTENWQFISELKKDFEREWEAADIRGPENIAAAIGFRLDKLNDRNRTEEGLE